MDSQKSYDFTHYKLLNVGGGNFNQRELGWLNLDYTFDATAKKRDWSLIDVVHNLMSDSPIPLPNECLSGVYTEHAMEHLLDYKVREVFKEIYRILKPGGFFRISVPDALKFWDIVTGVDSVAEEFPSAWRPKGSENPKEQVFLDAVCSPLRNVLSNDEVNTICYPGRDPIEGLDHLYTKFSGFGFDEQKQKPGAHISWWSCDKLKTALTEAGFSETWGPMERRDSHYKGFRQEFLDRTAFKCSVRVEARK